MASRILLVLLIATLINGALLKPVTDDERVARLFSVRGVGHRHKTWANYCEAVEDQSVFLAGFSFIPVKAAFKIVDTHGYIIPGDGVLDKKEFNTFVTILRIMYYCGKRAVAKAAAA